MPTGSALLASARGVPEAQHRDKFDILPERVRSMTLQNPSAGVDHNDPSTSYYVGPAVTQSGDLAIGASASRTNSVGTMNVGVTVSGESLGSLKDWWNPLRITARKAAEKCGSDAYDYFKKTRRKASELALKGEFDDAIDLLSQNSRHGLVDTYTHEVKIYRTDHSELINYIEVLKNQPTDAQFHLDQLSQLPAPSGHRTDDQVLQYHYSSHCINKEVFGLVSSANFDPAIKLLVDWKKVDPSIGKESDTQIQAIVGVQNNKDQTFDVLCKMHEETSTTLKSLVGEKPEGGVQTDDSEVDRLQKIKLSTTLQASFPLLLGAAVKPAEYGFLMKAAVNLSEVGRIETEVGKDPGFIKYREDLYFGAYQQIVSVSIGPLLREVSALSEDLPEDSVSKSILKSIVGIVSFVQTVSPAAPALIVQYCVSDVEVFARHWDKIPKHAFTEWGMNPVFAFSQLVLMAISLISEDSWSQRKWLPCSKSDAQYYGGWAYQGVYSGYAGVQLCKIGFRMTAYTPLFTTAICSTVYDWLLSASRGKERKLGEASTDINSYLNWEVNGKNVIQSVGTTAGVYCAALGASVLWPVGAAIFTAVVWHRDYRNTKDKAPIIALYAALGNIDCHQKILFEKTEEGLCKDALKEIAIRKSKSLKKINQNIEAMQLIVASYFAESGSSKSVPSIVLEARRVCLLAEVEGEQRRIEESRNELQKAQRSRACAKDITAIIDEIKMSSGAIIQKTNLYEGKISKVYRLSAVAAFDAMIRRLYIFASLNDQISSFKEEYDAYTRLLSNEIYPLPDCNRAWYHNHWDKSTGVLTEVVKFALERMVSLAKASDNKLTKSLLDLVRSDYLFCKGDWGDLLDDEYKYAMLILYDGLGDRESFEVVLSKFNDWSKYSNNNFNAMKALSSHLERLIDKKNAYASRIKVDDVTVFDSLKQLFDVSHEKRKKKYWRTLLGVVESISCILQFSLCKKSQRELKFHLSVLASACRSKLDFYKLRPVSEKQCDQSQGVFESMQILNWHFESVLKEKNNLFACGDDEGAGVIDNLKYLLAIKTRCRSDRYWHCLLNVVESMLGSTKYIFDRESQRELRFYLSMLVRVCAKKLMAYALPEEMKQKVCCLDEEAMLYLCKYIGDGNQSLLQESIDAHVDKILAYAAKIIRGESHIDAFNKIRGPLEAGVFRIEAAPEVGYFPRDVPADGDCGFHCLAVTREGGVTLLKQALGLDNAFFFLRFLGSSKPRHQFKRCAKAVRDKIYEMILCDLRAQDIEVYIPETEKMAVNLVLIERYLNKLQKPGEYMPYNQGDVSAFDALAYLLKKNLYIYMAHEESGELVLVNNTRFHNAGFEACHVLFASAQGYNTASDSVDNHFLRLHEFPLRVQEVIQQPDLAPNAGGLAAAGMFADREQGIHAEGREQGANATVAAL